MCIKYEASSEKDMYKSGWMVPPRPNVPGEESKPSKEELERRMSVLLPTKSPDKNNQDAAKLIMLFSTSPALVRKRP